MRVYLLQMYCGDYYCDEQHPAGVYSTEEKAEVAARAALEIRPEWDKDETSPNRAYVSGVILALEVDAPPEAR